MIPILAKLSAHPHYADALQFILIGLAIVIASLLVLSGFISGVGAAFRKQSQRPQATPAPDPIHTASLSDDNTPLVTKDNPATTPHLHALIAAAVHVALQGQPHRVIRIEPVSVGWAREGRREIFSSHRVR